MTPQPMTVAPVTVHLPGVLGPLLLIAMVGLVFVVTAIALGHAASPPRRTRDDQ